MDSESIFPRDPQALSSLRSTVTEHLAPTGRSRKPGWGGVGIAQPPGRTPAPPLPHSPPHSLSPPLSWAVKSPVSQPSSEALLRGPEDEPALPLCSTSPPPGHPVASTQRGGERSLVQAMPPASLHGSLQGPVHQVLLQRQLRALQDLYLRQVAVTGPRESRATVLPEMLKS